MSAVANWSDAFIGIPWLDKGRTRDGCDCWGLCRMVLAEAAGVEVPSYAGSYVSADEAREVAAIVRQEQGSPLWLSVEGPTRAFDIALFRRGLHRWHAGIVVAPGMLLHMVEEDAAKIERTDNGRWTMAPAGVWRWHGLT